MATPDPTKWLTRYPYASPADGGSTNAGTHDLQWYVGAQTDESGGQLHLSAARQTVVGAGTTYNYVSGLVASSPAFVFTYGYIEWSARIPAGQGLSPGLWMLAADNSFPPQIDIVRFVGQSPTVANMGLYPGTPTAIGTPNLGTFTGPNYSLALHTYALDWQAGSLTWYIDNVQRFQVTGATVPAVPMYLLAGLAVGGDLPGAPDGTTTFPASFDLDYVRVYPTKPGGAPSPTNPPSAPGRPVATAGDTTVSLAWSAPSSNGNSAITGYTVTTSPGGATHTSTVTSLVLTGLTNGTNYTFSVVATNTVGTSVASTASAVATPHVVSSGAGNRAFAARGWHADDGVYSSGNSSANAFTSAEANMGMTFPWDMLESSPDPYGAQGNVQDFVNDPAGNFLDGRVVPAMCFTLYGEFTGATCAQVAGGAVDVNLNNIATFINQIGFPMVSIRPGWEVDGGWFSWGADPTAYIQMFQHMATLFRNKLNVPLLMEWNAFSNQSYRGSDPNGYNVGGTGYATGHTTFDYYPGDSWVDVIGCDNYEANVHTEGDLVPPMAAAAAFAAAHNKQCGFSEWGLWDGVGGSTPTMEASGRAGRAMTAALAFFDSLPALGAPGCMAYHHYFDGDPGTGLFTIDDFPSAKAIYKARMALG